MKAGRLRHRVTLQRAVDTQDDTTGEMVRSWVDIGHWKCERKPASVREGLIDGGVRDEATTRLVGRYNRALVGLEARDRAVGTDGRIYNLAGPPQLGNANDEAVLYVKDGLNDG
jgi:head-tail adaptor